MGGGQRTVEDLGVTAPFWRGRRVLLTGITGFKGGWLALWLRQLGATVTGISLPPPTSPSLFEVARVGAAAEWNDLDVRDGVAVSDRVAACEPEVAFHLAAQPLVRASYEMPVATFDTNVLGTVHVLEALRSAASLRCVVVVTTDKCYENREWPWPYRESDALGGHDPYSSSKACAELVTSAYYRSFFKHRRVGVATARAGNVIGGGDWARDRLVPDMVAAMVARQPVVVRNPESSRPWQHVLEPLSGYLQLAERAATEPDAYSDAWNFGPNADAVRPVAELVDRICSLWGDGARWHSTDAAQPHEAKLLALDASKAHARLGWRPRLSLPETLAWTVAWYKAFRAGEDMSAFTLHQIRRYEEIRL
ncbi:MAG: CDP-glucose 4,6-dehydratase [Polyangiaceae bacterium]|jgi:CDP-glucose 4,6-dehydratase